MQFPTHLTSVCVCVCSISSGAQSGLLGQRAALELMIACWRLNCVCSKIAFLFSSSLFFPPFSRPPNSCPNQNRVGVARVRNTANNNDNNNNTERCLRFGYSSVCKHVCGSCKFASEKESSTSGKSLKLKLFTLLCAHENKSGQRISLFVCVSVCVFNLI